MGIKDLFAEDGRSATLRSLTISTARPASPLVPHADNPRYDQLLPYLPSKSYFQTILLPAET